VVIAKFPSFEAAKAFYHSPEYGKARAAAKARRHQAGLRGGL
jgi:uncharacterized protein (DUF1330 family)